MLAPHFLTTGLETQRRAAASQALSEAIPWHARMHCLFIAAGNTENWGHATSM